VQGGGVPKIIYRKGSIKSCSPKLSRTKKKRPEHLTSLSTKRMTTRTMNVNKIISDILARAILTRTESGTRVGLMKNFLRRKPKMKRRRRRRKRRFFRITMEIFTQILDWILRILCNGKAAKCYVAKKKNN